jgi:hypothetical protein
MADRAQVRSVDAIESFRTALLIYLPKARGALEEVSSEVMRTRMWLEHEQRNRWLLEYKRRSRALEQAQAQLFDARLSKIQTVTAAQQMNVIRAKRALREAEVKLVSIRKWEREIENKTDPIVKQLEQLNDFLVRDMAKSAAHLEELVKTLEAYADIRAPSAAGSTPSGGTAGAASGPAPEPGPGQAGGGGVS